VWLRLLLLVFPVWIASSPHARRRRPPVSMRRVHLERDKREVKPREVLERGSAARDRLLPLVGSCSYCRSDPSGL